MAQKWYKKATVQSSFINALIGVIPATIVGIATIYVQIYLAEKQVALSNKASKDQGVKDSIAEIRADKKFEADNLLAAKDLELNRLQFDLAKLKRKDDIELNKRLEQINNSQLTVSENQYNLQKKRSESQIVNDLLKFKVSVIELGQILPDYDPKVEDFKGPDSWCKKTIKLLETQLDNPILQEDKTLFSEWVTVLEVLNIEFWIYNYNPNFRAVSIDSLKKWVIQNPDRKSEHKFVGDKIVKLIDKSRRFYDIQAQKLMNIPYFEITIDSTYNNN